MDKFYEEAFDHLEEEIEDACEYLKEAEEAAEEGKTYLAEGLKKIAYDEYTHAHFLREYLMTKHEYRHHEKSAKIEEHWHKLTHRLFGE